MDLEQGLAGRQVVRPGPCNPNEAASPPRKRGRRILRKECMPRSSQVVLDLRAKESRFSARDAPGLEHALIEAKTIYAELL